MLFKTSTLFKLAMLCLMSMVVSIQETVAQSFALTGTVVNNKLEPIPFISVAVKELQRGARTDTKGEFSINLPAGRHEIILSSVGYKPLNAVVIITNADVNKRFILEPSREQMKKVVISADSKDDSKEIIRKLIARKKEIQMGAASYTFEAYIKATTETKTHKKKKKKKSAPSKKDSIPSVANEANKGFAEVSLRVSKSYPDKIKEERIGVNIKGDKTNFFYLSCTAGDFNFYDNLIRVKSLGNVSFLSPFSTSGLVAYRYQYKELFFDQGKMYHRIQFKPGALSNALLTGEVLIEDKTWAIKKITAAFPNHQTPEYKKFEISARYENIKSIAWLPISFEFKYTTAEKIMGETFVNFKHYNIDTTFNKKYFDNELSATSKEAYDRDTSFWQKTRPVPLSAAEIKIIHYKDSLYEMTHSDHYRDSIEKDKNKVRILNILWHGQEAQNWRKERYISLPALVQVWNPIAIGGPRYGPWFRYQKTYTNKRQVTFSPSVTYGPWNKDLRGRVTGSYLINPFNRTRLNWDIGRSTANLFWNDAFVNLFDRSNYFLKENITLGVRRELLNGLYIGNTLELGFRKSMHNLNINTLLDSLLYEGETRRPIDFENYAAFFNELEIAYTPKQKYIREPYEKVILGSRFPTFYAQWRKGIPGILKSIIKYDYIEIGARQELNLGTLGISTYNIKYGNFVSQGNVEPADYKFIARGNPYLFFNSLSSFQAMDSTFALFQGFMEGHFVHEFNGALLNKIPFMKKLKLAESAGAGFLIAPERDLRYVEAFAGIEKTVTVLRQPLRLGVWGVSSFANQFQNPVQLKFSLRVYNFRRDRWE